MKACIWTTYLEKRKGEFCPSFFVLFAWLCFFDFHEPWPSPVLCPKSRASFSWKDSMMRHLKKCTGPRPSSSLPPLLTFVAATATATPVASALSPPPPPSKRPRLDSTLCVPWQCRHFKVNGEPCLRVFGSKNDRAPAREPASSVDPVSFVRCCMSRRTRIKCP